MWGFCPNGDSRKRRRKGISLIMNQNLKFILKKENLENLLPLFRKHKITDSCLEKLCDQCLIDMGVDKLGDRKRLLSAFLHVSTEDAPGGTYLLDIIGGTLPHDSLLAGQEVSSFRIGKYPVMLEEWQMVKNWGLANGYELQHGEAEGCHSPVVMVSWYEALRWCNAKSESLNLSPCYKLRGETYRSDDLEKDCSSEVSWDMQSNGYRLPTEAEWEWAARSGICLSEEPLSGENRFRGACSLQNGLAAELPGKTTAETVSLLENYEAPPNVWEWCWDLAEENTASCRRIRGGCWNQTLNPGFEKLRVSRRPESRHDVVGIRLARICGGSA
jgi:sulfatase modifying factor 1